MKFGVFYVLESPDNDYRRAWEEMLDQIEYAESLGFESVWLAEHHGSTYGTMPSPQVAAAAVAERTRNMRIGMAVSILPFDNPIRIAEDYAMVDVISNGRLDFGVGRGYQPREFQLLGLGDKQKESREIFKESLEIIMGGWSHDVWSYQGNYYRFDEIEIIPKPVQKPHPPIYMAAISPESFELAAEKDLEIMVTPTLMSLDELKQHVLKLQRELVERGRDPLKLNFPMNWQMHIAETLEEAKRDTASAFGWYFKKVVDLVPQGASTPPGYEHYARLAAEFKKQGEVDVEDLRAAGTILLADPEEAVRQIHRLYDEVGQQQIFCWMRIGGLEHRKVMRSLKLFAEQVMPHCRALRPHVPEGLRDVA